MKRFAVVLSLLFLASSSAIAFQQSVEEHLNKGNELAAKFDHEGALKEFEAVLALDSQNYEAAWKISKELSVMGNKSEDADDKDVTENWYARSVDMADKAISFKQDGVEGHFYIAVAKGRLGLYRGKKEMIKLSKDVKKEVDIAIQLDPTFYRAYYLLGRWHFKLANIGWTLRQISKLIYGRIPDASNAEALRNYKKAIELNPNYVECHMELGRYYMQEDMWKDAVTILEKCLTLPDTEEKDPQFKDEAREMLVKAKKKA